MSGNNSVSESLLDGDVLKMAPAIVYASVMMLFGGIGNTVVCYIYGFRWKTSVTKIFIFLLAVLDLTNSLICIPTEIVLLIKSVSFEIETWCKITRFLTYVLNGSSSLVLVAIAADRYYKVCKPLDHLFTIQRARRTCLACVLMAVAVSWPSLVLYGNFTVPLVGGRRGTMCMVSDDYVQTTLPLIFYSIYFFCFFSIMVAIIVLYIMIAQRLLDLKKKQCQRFQSQYDGSRAASLDVLSQDIALECNSLEEDKNVSKSHQIVVESKNNSRENVVQGVLPKVPSLASLDVVSTQSVFRRVDESLADSISQLNKLQNKNMHTDLGTSVPLKISSGQFTDNNSVYEVSKFLASEQMIYSDLTVNPESEDPHLYKTQCASCSQEKSKLNSMNVSSDQSPSVEKYPVVGDLVHETSHMLTLPADVTLNTSSKSLDPFILAEGEHDLFSVSTTNYNHGNDKTGFEAKLGKVGSVTKVSFTNKNPCEKSSIDKSISFPIMGKYPRHKGINFDSSQLLSSRERKAVNINVSQQNALHITKSGNHQRGHSSLPSLPTEEECPSMVDVNRGVRGSVNVLLEKLHKKTAYRPAKTTRMLFAISFIFVISFLPFFIIVLIRAVRTWQGGYFYNVLSKIEIIFISIFVRSSFISNAANPLIYGICNAQFRVECQHLLRRISGKKVKLHLQVVEQSNDTL